MLAFLDTHALAWIYFGEIEKFTDKGRKVIDSYQLNVSPLVILELQYLKEIGRITVSPHNIIQTLETDFGLKIDNSPYTEIVQVAVEEDWTRDPFDRLIVASAKHYSAFLLSKDESILDNYKKAIW